MKRALFAICGFCLFAAEPDQSAAGQVGLIDIDGAIGPATASYIERAIGVATEHKDACLIIRLDTPGGLLDSTKEIVQSFYASQVPTVVYVAAEAANARVWSYPPPRRSLLAWRRSINAGS